MKDIANNSSLRTSRTLIDAFLALPLETLNADPARIKSEPDHTGAITP